MRSINPLVGVDCSDISERKMTEEEWAGEEDYASLREALAQALRRCDDKIASSALPELLRD